MNIGVADAFEVREHGHAALVLDALDKTAAAARNHDVDVLDHGQHLTHRGTVPRRNELDGCLRQTRFAQACNQALVQRGTGMQTFRAPTQNDRVPGLQAQSGRIRSDVRARFVDHTHDAERHAHTRDLHPVGARPFRHHLADRIG